MTSSVGSSLPRKETKKHAGNIPSKSKQKKLQKKSDKTSVYAAKMTPSITSSTGYGLKTVAPLVWQENLVCCDKCQKWRLLPYHHNPDKLPKKWLCSMIYWLPGMNSCDISEEETDRAAKALYQVHVSESQNSLNTLLDHGAATGITLDDLQSVDKTHQGGDIHGVIRREMKNLKAV